jgi:hypothetical protein
MLRRMEPRRAPGEREHESNDARDDGAPIGGAERLRAGCKFNLDGEYFDISVPLP